MTGKGESEGDPSGEEGFQVGSVAEQSTSERLFRVTGSYQLPSGQRCVSRASAKIFREG